MCQRSWAGTRNPPSASVVRSATNVVTGSVRNHVSDFSVTPGTGGGERPRRTRTPDSGSPSSSSTTRPRIVWRVRPPGAAAPASAPSGLSRPFRRGAACTTSPGPSPPPRWPRHARPGTSRPHPTRGAGHRRRRPPGGAREPRVPIAASDPRLSQGGRPDGSPCSALRPSAHHVRLLDRAAECVWRPNS